jgi:hypothetical protein
VDVVTRVLVEMLSGAALVRLRSWLVAWFLALLWPSALMRSLEITDLVKRSVWRHAAKAPPRECIWYSVLPFSALSFFELVQTLFAFPQVIDVPVGGFIDFPGCWCLSGLGSWLRSHCFPNFGDFIFQLGNRLQRAIDLVHGILVRIHHY